MSRRSYREHRAHRAAQAMSDDGTDRDSIASFSTFASHTSFGSVAFPSYNSFGAVGSAVSGTASPYYGSGAPNNHTSATGLTPAALSLRQRTYSNISSRSQRDASVSSPMPPHREFSPSPGPYSTSTPPPGKASYHDHQQQQHQPPDNESRDREKRRRRARNEERWRRVRAREAAHDAPVRRLAKFANKNIGGRGVLAATLAACMAVRVLLSCLVLAINSDARANIARKVVSTAQLCRNAKSVAPVVRPFVPLLCTALGVRNGAEVDAEWPGARAVGVVLATRVGLASLLWTAAIAWVTMEGWREGRTLRTRVAAVVYLALAPVLVLSDVAVLPVRAGLGLAAWALVATCSGHDGVAAALLAAAVWAGRYATAYVPAFVVYAVGKRIWLGHKGYGYFARLAVSAAFAIALLEALGPAPLRDRVRASFAFAQSLATAAGLAGTWRAFTSLFSLRNLLSLASLAPSTYLTLKASSALRPKSNEPVTPASVPATARLLPLALAATSGALALWPADAVLPLLPLAFASSLRRDDDEWAVAVQAQHVAAINLWSKIPPPLLPLAGAYMLAWSWLIGAQRDAPNLALRAHQWATIGMAVLAMLTPVVPASIAQHAVLGHAHTLFLTASVAALTVWANVRLVKTAWAVGAL